MQAHDMLGQELQCLSCPSADLPPLLTSPLFPCPSLPSPPLLLAPSGTPDSPSAPRGPGCAI